MHNLKISSGSELFDDFLEGGYERDTLTTLYGPSGTGKTTLCILASISTVKDHKKVIYVDTEGGFSIERLNQITENNSQNTLRSIILIKPTSMSEQSNAIDKLKRIINDKIGLVVIDTLTLFYRLELAKSKEVKSTNGVLINQLANLNEIARKKHIPVLVTNQVYSDFGNPNSFKMVGGQITEYASKCIISLEKQKQNRRKAYLITHRSLPEGKEQQFAIVNEGIIGTYR